MLKTAAALTALLLLVGMGASARGAEVSVDGEPAPSSSQRRAVVPTPLQRYATLSRTVEQAGSTASAQLLEDAADAASAVKRYAEALQLRRRALALRVQSRAMTVSDLVSSYASIAQELQHEGQYREALTILTKAGNMTSLDPTSRSILAHFRSSVHDCLGQAGLALMAFLEGLQYRQAARAGRKAATEPSSELQPAFGSALLDPLIADHTERLQLVDLMRKAQEAAAAAATTTAARASTAVAGGVGIGGGDGTSGGEAAAAVAASPAAGKGKKRKASRSLGASTDPAEAAALSRLDPLLLAQESDRQVDMLLSSGSWTNPHQLPKTNIPGLLSKPWHSWGEEGRDGNGGAGAAGGSYPWLAPVVELLRAATGELAEEYRALAREQRLFRETECIHLDPKALKASNGAGGRSSTSSTTSGAGGEQPHGGWSWYATNGYWTEQDEDGCALHTPAACRLLHRIADLDLADLVVHRAGYSAIGPRAHLRAHHGATNGQLKMHLGLIVPTAASSSSKSGSSGARRSNSVQGASVAATAASDPAPAAVAGEAGAAVVAGPSAATAQLGYDGLPLDAACALLRVGNETRAWKAGGVLFFDDSFQHEVWNHCESTRVVFQLVFRHPDLVRVQRVRIGGGAGTGAGTGVAGLTGGSSSASSGSASAAVAVDGPMDRAAAVPESDGGGSSSPAGQAKRAKRRKALQSSDAGH